jgi:hypothetical protein
MLSVTMLIVHILGVIFLSIVILCCYENRSFIIIQKYVYSRHLLKSKQGLVGILGHLELVSSLSPLVNELFRGIISWE